MDTIQPPTSAEPKPTIPAATLAACALARGEAQPDPATLGIEVRAAWRNLNVSGDGPECYRRCFPVGERIWRWLSEALLTCDASLPSYAAVVRADVYPGDLIATFALVRSHGVAQGRFALDVIHLVVASSAPLRPCEHHSRRDGQLEVTLPDGTTMTVPSPDWR